MNESNSGGDWMFDVVESPLSNYVWFIDEVSGIQDEECPYKGYATVRMYPVEERIRDLSLLMGEVVSEYECSRVEWTIDVGFWTETGEYHPLPVSTRAYEVSNNIDSLLLVSSLLQQEFLSHVRSLEVLSNTHDVRIRQTALIAW